LLNQGEEKREKKTETELRSLCINCGPEKSPCGQSFGHFASLYNKPKNKKKNRERKEKSAGPRQRKEKYVMHGNFPF